MEEGQRDLAGVVMRIDPVGHRAVAARRRLVAVDPQFERHDRAFRGAGDAGPVAAVDDRMRQHEQQVAARAWRSPRSAGTTFSIMAGDLRPDAFERGDRRKQRVEER